MVDGERITVGVIGPLTINDVETCIPSTLRGARLFCLPRSLVMHYLEQGQMETVLDSHSHHRRLHPSWRVIASWSAIA
jgi:hypothetical protein